ncbi:hypothetical protein HME9302_01606 [Alteripontixanthobacter maritimus]|uniref:Protein-S-isoprenylcysteine O-methyltransferase n=1 Tax=Alteripontixanthobacter maritimus TaxID=2161824 RepID=A0A369QBV6_9SPHN|nr:isoprenylcysteine carboxylmethyltransferase family protein [Alteripontixanthobacter maritimus]RDC60399.1 hypothetical protein HME9302_01606 [Alteripontixanthobacter maritimus]
MTAPAPHDQFTPRGGRARVDKTNGAVLPKSDVSAAVGFAGLLGLFAWIMVCRNWPEITATLGLGGPQQRLDGPYAALLGIIASALPMVLWSVLVDKVHRNPSTGIDWAHPKPLSAVIDVSVVKIAGLWATFAILAGMFMLARWYWQGQYLFAMEVFGALAIPLVLLSVPYILWLDRVMVQPKDASWHFGAMLLRRDAFAPDMVTKHWRAWIIKAFFGAFMVSILPGGFQAVINADPMQVLGEPVVFAAMLLGLMFVIDVQIGTVGYLLTLRPLDAHIRSGNPLLAGWVAALMCYPPFVFAFMGGEGSLAGGLGVIAYEVNTPGWGYWLGGSATLLWIWCAWLAILTAIYAWATLAFGIRFSNLTYRGVLTNGPYRFTRHPAYLSKNAFWWFGTMPFLVSSGSMTDMVRNTVFLGLVSGIYYWRARTEEAHLLAEDTKYADYHAWMEEHGIITGRLRKLTRLISARLGSANGAPAG